MPRANKASRYQDVKKWRKENPERNRQQNRTDHATYRGKPGSPERIAYNQAQRDRAIRRAARAAAAKAVTKAASLAKSVVQQRRTLGYVGPLKPNCI